MNIILDEKIKLPEEIDLGKMDKFKNSRDNSEDNTLLFDFDKTQADQERKQINNIIKDLRLHKQWL